MKRFFLSALVLCLILAMLCPSVGAVDADGEDASTVEEGLTFDRENKYEMSVLLEDIPFVVEAWIYFPADFTSYGGVIIGNYGIIQPCFHIEILAQGKPRLHYTNPTEKIYEKVKYDVVFENVNVYTGEWLHLAVAIDDATNEAHCFVDGKIVETVSNITMFDEDVLSIPFAVGGDHRGFNNSYFRGQLRSLALYSEYRDIRKIRVDMQEVDTADEDLMAYYDFTEKKRDTFSDHKDGKYDLTVADWWLEEKEAVEDYAYSFCLVGDTQIEAYYDPDRFHYIYDWIVANAADKKMAYVMGLGDITDRNSAAEWQLAQENVSKMNGVVPYSLVRGNHDGITQLNQTFAQEWYTSTCGGFFEEGHIENSWRTFRAGKTDYLVLTLEYGPRDVVLEWAAQIVEQHPTHKTIITTHAYLTRDGSRLDAEDYHSPTRENRENNGEDMWDKLISKYENIFLVVSGHIDCEKVVVSQEKGDHGNLVTQILIDMQGISLREYKSEGALAAVTMLYFNEDGTMAQMETYSTARELYFRSDNQGVIYFEEQPEPIIPEESTPEESTSEESIPNDTADMGVDTEPSDGDGSDLTVVWIVCGAVAATVAVGSVITVVVIRKRKVK